MAVKKTAKKSPVKKAVVKKAVAKKTVVKKAVAKKSPVKKAAVKKAVAKKAPVKKAPVKKAVALESPLFAPAIVTPAPVTISSAIPLQFDSTPDPILAPATPLVVSPAPKSSSRVVLWVVIGVIAIAGLVVARNHKVTTPDSAATPAATASETPAMTATDTSSPAAVASTPATSTTPTDTATPTTTASNPAPIGIVAHYTATGAAIFWKPAPGASGLTTYNVEASSSGGAFKLVATVPATQLSLNVTETAPNGWTSFKISAVYSDGTKVSGRVFGLPGQYA